MSVSHPIIAVTGSSGAGTSTVKHAFEDIFRRGGIKPVVVEGKEYPSASDASRDLDMDVRMISKRIN